MKSEGCRDGNGLQSIYHIRPNFRGTQFLRIAIFKHFAETFFTDQEIKLDTSIVIVGILKFCKQNFRGLLGIHKNRENYVP